MEDVRSPDSGVDPAFLTVGNEALSHSEFCGEEKKETKTKAFLTGKQQNAFKYQETAETETSYEKLNCRLSVLFLIKETLGCTMVSSSHLCKPL